MPRMALLTLAIGLLATAHAADGPVPLTDPDPWSAIEPLGPADAAPAQPDPAAQSAVVQLASVQGESAQPPATEPVADPRPLSRRGAGRSPVAAAPAGSTTTTNSAFRTWGALLGVLALICLLAWGYRALMNGSGATPGRPRHPGLIEVVSRVTLSPRHSLCLVRVGPRLILLGLGAEGVTTLDASQDAELAARMAASSQPPDAGAFDEQMSRASAEYAAAPAEVLRSAGQRLAGALRRMRGVRGETA